MNPPRMALTWPSSPARIRARNSATIGYDRLVRQTAACTPASFAAAISGLRVGLVGGHRLFDDDVDSALDRFDGMCRVQPVRTADVHHVGLGLVEHGPEVIEGIDR